MLHEAKLGLCKVLYSPQDLRKVDASRASNVFDGGDNIHDRRRVIVAVRSRKIASRYANTMYGKFFQGEKVRCESERRDFSRQ